jgi:hypothetical protein
MAILVAPAAAQCSVMLVPGLMLVGSATKFEIVGTEPFPEVALDEDTEAQPARPIQANRARISV